MVFIDSFENCVLKCCSLYKNHDDETAFSLSSSAFTVAIYDYSSTI